MGKKPTYAEIDGYLCPPSFVEEVLRMACQFKPGKGDVVVATYPKCGTTWTLQIVVLILRKGDPPKTVHDYFSSMPFLETMTHEEVAKMSKPGCIKMHLPFHKINFSKEAKYIYVARHPADCVVSYYHHTRFFPVYQFSDGSFDDFFDVFLKGQVDCNDYFDHLLSWYEHRYEPNIVFLTYESMMKDIRGTIFKIAKFLGDEYYQSLLENDEEILKKVLKYSSLDYMKDVVDGFWKEGFLRPPEGEIENVVMKKYFEKLEKATMSGHSSQGNFVRKGEVGQGKIILSSEQLERLNKRILEKTAHSDVMDLWKLT